MIATAKLQISSSKFTKEENGENPKYSKPKKEEKRRRRRRRRENERERERERKGPSGRSSPPPPSSNTSRLILANPLQPFL
jgi:hypothetical protein